MKSLLAASAALFVLAGSVPASAAVDYPWCQRTRNTGGTPQCSFNTFQQCQATISGVGGDCVQNPRLAYDQYRPSQRRVSRRAAPYDGGWDNGWDNGWRGDRW